MTKIRYIAFLIALAFCFSCVQDQDDVFDDSSTNRKKAALEEYEKILTGATNGWLFEYYPEDTQYGGFNLYMNFSVDGKVTVTGESSILKEDNETTSSQYVLKSDMGPVLSFDTYNRVFHQFSDPNPDGLGYEGDYEFIILSATADKVELKGKKNHIKMSMTRFPENTSWQEYKAKVDNVVKEYPGFTMQLVVGDEVISLDESTGLGRYLSYKVVQATNTVTKGHAYVYTPEGLKFKDPVIVNGQSMQNFEVSATDRTLVCTDGNTNAHIEMIPLNEAFTIKNANWFFDKNRMGTRFTTLWNTIDANLGKGLDEELIYLFLRTTPTNQRLSFTTYSNLDETYYHPAAEFYMDFEVAEEDNELRIYYAGGGDQMAMLLYYDYFRTLLSYISDEAPYVMTYNNLKIPTEITFTRTDNPDVVWFVVTR